VKQKLAELRTVFRKLFNYDPARRRTRLPGPVYAQLQTVDGCNGACLMCPHAAPSRPGEGRVMEPALYERILEELGALGTVRSIVLMLQNEPLLDPLLAGRIRHARAVLGGRGRLAVVTNGTLLTPDRTTELLDAGLNGLDVSIDAYREETYRIIRPGLDFGLVQENARWLLANRRNAHVRIRFLVQRANEAECRDFVRYWRSLGAHVFVSGMTNRAGAVKGFDRLRSKPPLRARWRRKALGALGRLAPVCLAPFTSLCVLVDGRVILCCHDWMHAETYGNLATESLAELWNGDRLNGCRHLLWTHRPGEIALCRQCCRFGGD
jgi:MoaA/NifB/PqqE/SkfB family radical SAM enzyme